MIKHIIFDLGNVLLDQKTVTADAYLSRILSIKKDEAESFYQKYVGQVVSGMISFNELVDLFKKKFNLSRSVKEITDKYVELYIHDVQGVNEELLKLIKILGKRYKIYIMTNTLEPNFEHWTTMGLNKYFKRVFRSDTDHFMKPEREAYEFVVNAIDAEPDECVFIDDLEKNVKGAESLGIRGIVYRNSTDLVRDLVKIGVAI